MSLRESPKNVYCDQGFQFVAMSKEFETSLELVSWDCVSGCSAQQGIEWVFAPTQDQHMNACAESLIKIYQVHLL